MGPGVGQGAKPRRLQSQNHHSVINCFVPAPVSDCSSHNAPLYDRTPNPPATMQPVAGWPEQHTLQVRNAIKVNCSMLWLAGLLVAQQTSKTRTLVWKPDGLDCPPIAVPRPAAEALGRPDRAGHRANATHPRAGQPARAGRRGLHSQTQVSSRHRRWPGCRLQAPLQLVLGWHEGASEAQLPLPSASPH
jgi:hypothetical protein